MEKYYTGVGSRQTPSSVCLLMTITAKFLDGKGYTLRSGGAVGADYSFEMGASNPIIYSPNDKHHPASGKPSIIPDVEQYRDMAGKCCLHFSSIKSKYVRDLHTRNICQVIGHEPQNVVRSDFLIAYTLNGDYLGGTTTALRCAELFDVPIFNFGKYHSTEVQKTELKNFLKQHMRKE